MPFRASKRKKQGLKLDGTHEILFCADDVNILGENIDYHTENRRALSDATKEVVGTEVNPKKTKYMLMSCYYKAGQNHSIKIANGSFEDVAKFKYLGTIIT
jgi:hypothetical protein